MRTRHGRSGRPGDGTSITRAETSTLRGVLRAAGLRVTLPRLAVIWVLRRADTPLSHGDVAAALADRGLDRATVYRNLLDLVRVGLARRTDLGDHVWRFESARSGAVGRSTGGREHPHFVCNECGSVECLDDLTLQLGGARRAPRAVRTKAVEILFKGRCDRCE
jgi:Fur family ferric uptake transcriptional regulator